MKVHPQQNAIIVKADPQVQLKSGANILLATVYGFFWRSYRWKEKKSGKKIDFNREIFVRMLVCTYAYKSDCNARIRFKTDFQQNKIVVEWYRYLACHGMAQTQPRFLFFDDHEEFQRVRLKRGASNSTSSIDLSLEISEELISIIHLNTEIAPRQIYHQLKNHMNWSFIYSEEFWVLLKQKIYALIDSTRKKYASTKSKKN